MYKRIDLKPRAAYHLGGCDELQINQEKQLERQVFGNWISASKVTVITT